MLGTKRKLALCLFAVGTCSVLPARASQIPPTAPPQGTAPTNGREKLKQVQNRIGELRQGISSARSSKAAYGSEVAKLNHLLKLQAEEIDSGKRELADLEVKLTETKQRQTELQAQLSERKRKLRESLSQLPALGSLHPLTKLEKRRAIMTDVHGTMVDRWVKQERDSLTNLRKSEEELTALNEKLSEDRARIEAHVEDLQEKQAVLALNRELSSKRLEVTRAQETERVQEFERVKSEERQMEAMIQTITENQFDAPVHAGVNRAKTGAPPPVKALSFLDRKGEFALPLVGAVIKQFGKKYDPRTNLYTFNKGIEIAAQPNASVHAIHKGKIVYAGRLGSYRDVLIVDHGKQFYSLLGNLGETLKKVGDEVQEGETIGKTRGDDTPLYLEIRQRHIAVNPVPWFRDLKLLARAPNG